VDNQTQPTVTPNQPIPQPSPSIPTTNWSTILLFLVLGLAVIAISIFIGYQIGRNQITNQQPAASPSPKINTNFSEIGSLQNCSSNTSDMPYDKNCWGLAYLSDQGKTFRQTTLTLNSNSFCNFGQHDELCLSSKLETFYKSNTVRNKKSKWKVFTIRQLAR
jgi:hypothetical protein